VIRIWRELEQNRRLRLGLMVAVALVWCFALLELDEQVTASRKSMRQLQGQIARIKATAKEDHWHEYREMTTRTLAQFRSRAWREESEGRIQAHLQDWLREKLAHGGLEAKELVVSIPQASGPAREGAPEPVVSDEPPPENELPTEMRVVHARMVFDFQEGPFNDLITTLSSSDHWLWVERLTVRNWGTPTVELELGALFVIGPRQEGV
jgi:hypothetical protein